MHYATTTSGSIAALLRLALWIFFLSFFFIRKLFFSIMGCGYYIISISVVQYVHMHMLWTPRRMNRIHPNAGPSHTAHLEHNFWWMKKEVCAFKSFHHTMPRDKIKQICGFILLHLIWSSKPSHCTEKWNNQCRHSSLSHHQSAQKQTKNEKN